MPRVDRHFRPRGNRRLPLFVTLVCGAASVWLFFVAVAPALRERAALRQVEERQTRLLEALQTGNADLRARLAHLGEDPQTLLVEIDRLHLTPNELIRRFGGESGLDAASSDGIREVSQN